MREGGFHQLQNGHNQKEWSIMKIGERKMLLIKDNITRDDNALHDEIKTMIFRDDQVMDQGKCKQESEGIICVERWRIDLDNRDIRIHEDDRRWK